MPEIKATMAFRRADGKNSTITVTDANASLTEAALNTVMDTILTKNVFAPEASDFTEKVSGKLISTTTQDFAMITV